MMHHHYPWLRYWLPRNTVAPTDSDGFLRTPSPVQSWDGIATPGHTLVDLAETPCLILLGEPGMGKSTVLADTFERVDQAVWATQRIDLKEVENEASLNLILTDILNTVRLPDRFVLFIDSLDEALLRVQTIADSLIRSLTRLAPDAVKSGRAGA